MLRVVPFITACCFVAIAHAKDAECPAETSDAEKNIEEPNEPGVYKLKKSTHADEKRCFYVSPPSGPGKADYKWAHKECSSKGKCHWVNGTGTGDDGVYTDLKHEKTKMYVLYYHTGVCYVTLREGDKDARVKKYLDLWQRTEGKRTGQYGKKTRCCRKAFQAARTQLKLKAHQIQTSLCDS
uniref:Putative salivary secreted lipocalin n=1 Tax=Ornithodoros turicata TaxID=34597 RepID=A0A2R5LMP4_9ACAR